MYSNFNQRENNRVKSMTSSQKSGRSVFETLPFEIFDFKENEVPKVKISISDLIFVGPKRYVEMEPYKKYGLDIYNFEARPDDVYLVGFPRSGTTLHTEMVWLIGNDLDYEGAAKNFLAYRFPHIDLCLYGRYLEHMKEIAENDDVNGEKAEIAQKYLELTLKGLAERKSPRFIKSHLPLSLMPPHIFDVGAKIIYCARNPKDILVSRFHASKFFVKVTESKYSLRDWFEDFKNDLGWNSPYFEHVKEAWERRNDKNFLFLFHEDTLQDKRQTIHKVADFLGKKLTKEQIDCLEDYLNIDNFRENKAVNNDQLVKLGLAKDINKFIRRGKAGGWSEVFDDELKKDFDELIEEKLKGTDLKFPEI